MKCVLHIGCEKTGTTSIQSALSSKAAGLRRAGIHPVESAGFPNAVALALASQDPTCASPGYTRLGVANSTEARRRWVDELWQAIRTELDEVTPGCKQFLLSSEHLHSHNPGIEDIAALKLRLEEAGATEFCIVVYVRRQIDVAVSRFSTALKAGYTRSSVLPPMGNSADFLYDYDALLERWTEVFGDDSLAVRAYEVALASRHGIVGDFLTLLGFELPVELDAVSSVRENSALSGNAQRVLMAVNQGLESVGCNREDGARLRRALLPLLERDEQGDRVLPSREHAEAFQRQFDERNAAMFDRWFGGRKVFPDEFDAFPVNASSMEISPELLLLAKTMLLNGETG